MDDRSAAGGAEAAAQLALLAAAADPAVPPAAQEGYAYLAAYGPNFTPTAGEYEAVQAVSAWTRGRYRQVYGVLKAEWGDGHPAVMVRLIRAVRRASTAAPPGLPAAPYAAVCRAFAEWFGTLATPTRAALFELGDGWRA